jgi:hypothetical protein
MRQPAFDPIVSILPFENLQLLIQVTLGLALMGLKQVNEIFRDRQRVVLNGQSLRLDGFAGIAMNQ